MSKLSIRHFLPIKKISRRDEIDEDTAIKRMKECVKKDPTVIEKFKKYDISINEIDNVPVAFKDLDVSAKTKDKKIYLNRKMLEPDSDIKDPTHYLAHELMHWLQQTTGNVAGHQVKDYLEKPTEVEAFQVQVEFKETHEGEDEADKYVEELLDHHDVDSKKEREEKTDELKNG